MTDTEPYNENYYQEEASYTTPDEGEHNGYNNYNYTNYDDSRNRFSFFSFLTKLIGFLIFCAIIFGLLIELETVKGFDQYKPSVLWSSIKEDFIDTSDTEETEVVKIDLFEDCKQDKGTITEKDELKYCTKDGVMYFQSIEAANIPDFIKNETTEEYGSAITLQPKEAAKYSKLVIGSGYNNIQHGVTAFLLKAESSSAYSYMYINNSKLPNISIADKDKIEKVSNFIKTGIGYDKDPHPNSAFRIREENLSETYKMGNIETAKYDSVEGFRAIYTMDGEGETAIIIIRIFAEKDGNVILLEQRLDKSKNEEIHKKYYASCLNEKGLTDESKECYSEKLKNDEDFQAEIKQIANYLTISFKL